MSTRKKKKSGASGRRLSPSGALASVRAAWGWVGRLALPIVVAGLVASAALAYGPLRRRVAAGRADPVRVEVAWPAIAGAPGRTWLPADERDRLRAIALAIVTPDPLDSASLGEARAALARTGWFVTSPTIHRRPAGLVEVRGVWRVPAAVVRVGVWDWLVASDGALLPVRYKLGSAVGVPVIVNPYTGPPKDADGAPGFGLVWPGGDVPAAIRLARFLRDSPHADAIAAIDAARFIPDGVLTVVMRSGGRIVWGGAPGADHPGEAPDPLKRERFDRIAGDPALVARDKPPVEIHTRFVLIDESASP